MIAKTPADPIARRTSLPWTGSPFAVRVAERANPWPEVIDAGTTDVICKALVTGVPVEGVPPGIAAGAIERAVVVVERDLADATRGLHHEPHGGWIGARHGERSRVERRVHRIQDEELGRPRPDGSCRRRDRPCDPRLVDSCDRVTKDVRPDRQCPRARVVRGVDSARARRRRERRRAGNSRRSTRSPGSPSTGMVPTCSSRSCVSPL